MSVVEHIEGNVVEQTLWALADKLHSHMNAAEYKRVAPSLIFRKHIHEGSEQSRRTA